MHVLDPFIYDDDGQVWDVRQIICAGSSDDDSWEESGKPGGYTPLQESWFRVTANLEKLVITGFLIKPLPSTLFQLSKNWCTSSSRTTTVGARSRPSNWNDLDN